MREAFVSGVGWVSSAGLGTGRGSTPFSWGDGPLPSIKRSQVFSEPHPRFGRLDRYSRLGVAAIAMALRDAGLEGFDLGGERASLIASTVHGCLHTDIAFLDGMRERGIGGASPQLFAYTLSNSLLGEAAIEFGFTGETCLFNEAHLTGKAALKAAIRRIVEHESRIVTTGICDLGAPGLLAPDAGCGGALFFVLTLAPNGTPYGRIAAQAGNLLFEGEPVKDMIELAGRLGR